jgi:hypothetical protein
VLITGSLAGRLVEVHLHENTHSVLINGHDTEPPQPLAEAGANGRTLLDMDNSPPTDGRHNGYAETHFWCCNRNVALEWRTYKTSLHETCPRQIACIQNVSVTNHLRNRTSPVTQRLRNRTSPVTQRLRNRTSPVTQRLCFKNIRILWPPHVKKSIQFSTDMIYIS